MGKRVFVILLSVLIVLMIPVDGYVKAQALPNYTYPTFTVIEGSGGVPSVTTSGPTAGGLFAFIAGIQASIWQVDLIVDNWDMFVDYIGDMVRFGEDWTSRLWDQMTWLFVHKETGKTLGQAVSDGDNINYFDFYAPNFDSLDLEITEDMMLQGARTLADVMGLDSISPDHNTLIGRVNAAVEKRLIKNNPLYQPFTFNRPEWLAYENVVLNWNSYSSYLTFYCWDNLPNKGLKAYVSGNYLYIKSPSGSLVDMYRISFRNDSYGKHYENKNEYVSYQTEGNLIGTYSDYLDLGKYSTNLEILSAVIPFDLLGQDLMLYNTPFSIDTSRYKTDGSWREGLEIKINEYLVDEMQKVGGLDKLKSTDDLMKVVKNADAKARENYDRILPGEVTDTSQPGLHIPILSDIWEWLQNIWDGFINACKTVLQWAFVPAPGTYEAFVTQATDIVESNGNILTYPVELVIRFLNKLLTLDKEDCIMVIPPISFMQRQIYAGTTFNFTQHIKRGEFSNLYNYYILFTDALMIIFVCNLAIKKGDEIIRGN